MNESEKKRLALLKKANRLGMILPKYLNRLMDVEPKFETAKILDSNKIEEMVINLNGNNKEIIITKRASKRNPTVIQETLKMLSQELDSDNYFSINKLQELWFAELNTFFVVANYEKIIEIDGDLFIVHDKEVKNGLWVDLNEEYWTTENTTNYEFVYELKIWGSEWTNKLLK
ncbi:hypothetical protein [Algibacter aquimarinus]